MCAAYEPDSVTGQTIYGYVADSCADNNFWCQDDTFHLDISTGYLRDEGILSGWNGRQIEWAYLNGPPSGCVLSSQSGISFGVLS